MTFVKVLQIAENISDFGSGSGFSQTYGSGSGSGRKKTQNPAGVDYWIRGHL